MPSQSFPCGQNYVCEPKVSSDSIDGKGLDRRTENMALMKKEVIQSRSKKFNVESFTNFVVSSPSVLRIQCIEFCDIG